MSEARNSFDAEPSEEARGALSPEMKVEIEAGRLFPSYEYLMTSPEAFAAVLVHLIKAKNVDVKMKAFSSINHYLTKLEAEQDEHKRSTSILNPEIQAVGWVTAFIASMTGAALDYKRGGGPLFTVLFTCVATVIGILFLRTKGAASAATQKQYERYKKALMDALQAPPEKPGE